jgi:GTPase SAR1 family protein
MHPNEKDKKRDTMEKKIGVIGHVGHGKTVLAEALINHASLSDVVVMCEPIRKNWIEVEGVKYREIEKPKVNGRIAQIMLMAQMMGGYGESREPQRPDVDIISEYKLIQQKKSNLSRSQRDWVVSQFHSRYEEIK